MILTKDEFRFAAHQASNFLEFTLFFRTEMVRAFTITIKLGMSTTEMVVRLHRNQMEIPVKFIPDEASWVHRALQNRKSNPATLDGGLLADVICLQNLIQIAAMEQ